jgi:hypothetical protein
MVYHSSLQLFVGCAVRTKNIGARGAPYGPTTRYSIFQHAAADKALTTEN